MEITFGRVRHTADGKVAEVFAAGRSIGEIYKEPEMDEWAADAELESHGFENANGRTLPAMKRYIRDMQCEREAGWR